MIAVLSLGVALVGCRGSENDDADSDTTEAPAGGEATTGDTEGTAAEGTSAETDATTGETDATTDGTGGGGGVSVDCPASEDGLTDTEIVLGGTYPLSGPVAAYASVPVGIAAWFDHLNATEGGITAGDGVTREVRWEYLDDQYAPPRTLENVRRLVESDGVWLVLNPLGTPSNLAIRDYMNEATVPQLYVATGAATWGNDIEQYPWTIGYQPDYESEGIAYAQYALEENPDAQVGVLYANDDFGKDYLTGIREGMGDAADQIVSEVTYETTDATIDSQVSQVVDAGADVFMLIATPQFAIQGIQRLAALGYDGTKILTSVSSSVGAVIEPAGFEAATDFVTSVYLKDPTDPAYDDDPAMVEYQEVMAEYYPDANTDDALHLYGMSVGQLFQRTLEGMDTLCREAVMEAAKNFDWPDPPLLLEGIGIHTEPGDAFPIQEVQLQRWNGENWEKFGDIIDAADIND
jgi:branched-chain amino acid transport system substrate-binding protein